MKTIPCPKCGTPIDPAGMMGALGAGRPKNYSKAERARRRARMLKLNAERKERKP